MLLNGFNPYRFAPVDQMLSGLRDVNWLNIQNPSIHTMYPPLAQLFFALTQAIQPGITALRVVAILAHLGSILICFLWLKESGHDPRKAILLAWSPLCIIEFSNSGHIDAMAIFFMLCAFYLSHRAIFQAQTGKSFNIGSEPSAPQGFHYYQIASGLCLSAAVLLKVFPIFCLPLFLPAWKKQGIFAFSAPLAVASLLFLDAGKMLISGTAYFTFFSTFNASAFAVLWLSLQQFFSKPVALYLSRMLVYAIFLFFWLREFSNKSNFKAEYLQTSISRLIWIYGLIFILSPTLHPWYLTWILPFLCFTPSVSWILLSGLVFLSRSVYANAGNIAFWQDVGALRLLEYIPFYVLLFTEKLPTKPRFSFPFRLSSMKSDAQ